MMTSRTCTLGSTRIAQDMTTVFICPLIEVKASLLHLRMYTLLFKFRHHCFTSEYTLLFKLRHHCFTSEYTFVFKLRHHCFTSEYTFLFKFRHHCFTSEYTPLFKFRHHCFTSESLEGVQNSRSQAFVHIIKSTYTLADVTTQGDAIMS